ncbi:MAG: response regulator [Hydrogenophaga sp.]|uniref:ATP-binding protein n=1 Tax=Hydrogenophaga sp. TaxID=1904254 RepID=UPI002619EFDA|nr:ATP-binding protein [Hydrogenophaga sp.]MCV0437615.1 response regulator [Hydrogenophaga sp.]
MKLQHKAWALILTALALSACTAMLGARYIVGDSFAQLETAAALREGERARRVFNQQVQALSATAQDYAFWNDAVEFVTGHQPDFMSSNFEAENMGYLRISEILVFDGGGRALATLEKTRDGSLASLNAERTASFQALAAQVLAAGGPKRALQTLRAEDGELRIVIAAAIHRQDLSDQKTYGVMVMTRRFDDTEIALLAEVLMTPARLSFDVAAHPGPPIHVHRDEEEDVLHVVLEDHTGQPVADLVLGLDRRLQARGRALSGLSMVVVAVTSLMASLLLVWLLDRFLLKRLQRLYGDIEVITRDGPTAAPPVRVQGRDEISALATGINHLLARVRSDAQQQQQAHERQEATRAQMMQGQKAEALGRLAGGIAHDINNSLAAVSGWVRLTMEDLEKGHPGHESLEQALKATRYADGLIRQLLAFGRKTQPKLQPLHLKILLEDTRRLVSAGLTRECEIVCVGRVEADVVEADPTQLQQVVVNLLINAADAMNGKGRIEVTLDEITVPFADADAHARWPGACALAPGRYLVVGVRDFGPGVPAEIVDQVFEPFFTTKGAGRGTGLGLSVAQGITVRHGGHIGLRSVPGEGAHFHIYLPACGGEAAAALPATTTRTGSAGRELLFVDDDQLVRQSWSALLERRGWQVTRARDGEEAWSYLVQSPRRWDVVLTDYAMPRLNGAGLAERIRAMDQPPPVVLLSGNLDEAGSHLPRELFAAVLRKPIEAAELDAVLMGVVRRTVDDEA